MVRRLLSPILALILVVPSAVNPAFADSEVTDPCKPKEGEAPSWCSFDGNVGKIKAELSEQGLLTGIERKDSGEIESPVNSDTKPVAELLQDHKTFLDAFGSSPKALEVQKQFSAVYASIIQKSLEHEKFSDEALKKFLKDPAKLAALLNNPDSPVRTSLLMALRSTSDERLDQLGKALKAFGGGDDLEAAIAKMEAALKLPEGHPDRIHAERFKAWMDTGNFEGKPPAAPERDDDSVNNGGNERRIGRSEENLASIGFNGRQAYGEFGDRHVYKDAKGNTVSLSLATITRPDGTKEDLITVVNLNDPTDPEGTSYSLRTDAGRLEAGIPMTLGGVPVTIKVGAGGTIALTGPGGEMKNGLDPASGPMGLSQLYAYRAARVYQYGKVVTIGGKQYYAAPETYGVLQGEGENLKLQGFGQITYWPVDDLRKIFGEEDPPGSGDWVDKIDPQTFDYKDLDLADTAFAAGFSTMRPQLGATVVKREGLQDVQILRASAGRDASGQYWDAVWKNGEYVLEPGMPPQTGVPPTGSPGPGNQLPPEEAEKLLAGLNAAMADRVKGKAYKFAFTTTGQLAIFEGDKGMVFEFMSPSSLAQISFMDGDNGILKYPTGLGGYAFTDLRQSDVATSGGKANTSVFIKSGSGFQIKGAAAPYSVYEKLMSGELKRLDESFEIKNKPDDFRKLLVAKMKDFPNFGNISGNSDELKIDLKNDKGESIQVAFKYDGENWKADLEASDDGKPWTGPAGSIALDSEGDSVSPQQNASDMPKVPSDPMEQGGKDYKLVKAGTGASGIYFRATDDEGTAELKVRFSVKEAAAGQHLTKDHMTPAYVMKSMDGFTVLGDNLAPDLKKKVAGKGAKLDLADMPNLKVGAVDLPAGFAVGDLTDPKKLYIQQVGSMNKAGGGWVLMGTLDGKTTAVGWIAVWGDVTPANALSLGNAKSS